MAVPRVASMVKPSSVRRLALHCAFDEVFVVCAEFWPATHFDYFGNRIRKRHSDALWKNGTQSSQFTIGDFAYWLVTKEDIASL